ncbi:hypothetical protein C7212DRAFT_186916 [Tuber magnatum]|uniref:Uncharacterized protein n=1 Tax=Tuber magnatum TaxID=42249 RepID=A0A317SPM8_9PEZI|nr:hypothetical protein C7212DRAFT_186916 [Tuber magnatum]
MSAPPAFTAPKTHAIRKPTGFLALGPVHSTSFPKVPTSPKLSPTTAAIDAVVDAPPLSPTQKAIHRSSSTSSVGSLTEKRRFLKLGPVHWGGAIGENDYAIED